MAAKDDATFSETAFSVAAADPSDEPLPQGDLGIRVGYDQLDSL